MKENKNSGLCTTTMSTAYKAYSRVIYQVGCRPFLEPEKDALHKSVIAARPGIETRLSLCHPTSVASGINKKL